MQVWTFYFASETCWVQENKLQAWVEGSVKYKGSREMEKSIMAMV